MKKIPIAEQNKETKGSAAARQMHSADAPASAGIEQTDAEDPMAGLQADLDRFRDLALRSQADFENYKKRSAREKEEAIKYANSSLLQRLAAILDNFELGLAAAKAQGEESPIYSGMVLVQKQLNNAITTRCLALRETPPARKSNAPIANSRLRFIPIKIQTTRAPKKNSRS